jgi:hypothetical protein
MKRYIKTTIATSDISSIRRNLFLFYGLLKNESYDFFKDFDDVIYRELLDDTEHPDARFEFYKKYLPLVKKCKEIMSDIKKDVTGHVIDQALRYEMYDMAKEILLNFPQDWKNASKYVVNR